MKDNRIYRLGIFFLGCLVFSFVMAYGSTDRSQDTPSEGNADQEIEKVHEGGTLTVACPEHVRTLDPQKADLKSERWVIEQIYDGLFEYDPNDRIVPVLAAGFPEKIGEYEYLVELKSGLKFSDGTELDANDVVFTLRRLLNPATQCPTRDLFSNLTAIEATSKRTVKVTTGPDCPDFLELLTRMEAYPLSSETVTKYGNRYGWVASIGVGPFRLKEWDREKEMILERIYAYPMTQPFLHRIVFRFPRPGVDPLRELRLARNELVSNPSPLNASRLSSISAYRVESSPGQRICQIYINPDQYPFDRPGIRRALSLGIDRQGIVDRVFYRFATSADTCVPPWHRYHDPNGKIQSYDPNQALKILAGEGFSNEFPVSFSLMYTDEEPFRSIADLIKEQLSLIGIQIHKVPLAKKDLFDYVYGRGGRDRSLFQAALEDWEDWRGGGGIDQFAWRLYHSSSPECKLGGKTYLWEQDLEAAVRACDPDIRDALFRKAVMQIDQSMVSIYLCYPHRIWAARKWVNGDFCNSLGHLFLEKVWVR